MIFALALAVLLLFLKIAYDRINEISEQEDYVHMYNLADAIRREVLLASQVHTNYLRRFELPNTINGKNYTIRLLDDNALYKQGIEINLTEINGRVLRSDFYTLPVDTKGQFSTSINEEVLEHCVTKSDYDNIRISRNQASIEFVALDNNHDGTFEYDHTNIRERINNGKLQVNAGAIVEVVVRLNCVENVQAIQFTLGFENLEYVDIEGDSSTHINGNIVTLLQRLGDVHIRNPPFNMDVQSSEFAFFKRIFDEIEYEGKVGAGNNGQHNYWDPTNTDGDALSTISGGMIAYDFQTGSGDLAKIRFEVTGTSGDTASIVFDPDFEQSNGLSGNLVILDTSTGHTTTVGLPTSKVGAYLDIT